VEEKKEKKDETPASSRVIQTGAGSNEYLEFQKALEMHNQLRATETKNKPADDKGSGLAVEKQQVIEKLRQKKEDEEKKLALKPIYISKQERESQKSKEQAEEKKALELKEKEEEDKRKQLERAARYASRGGGASDRTRRRETREERDERDKELESRREERLKSKDEREKEKFSTVIKDRYLGKKKKKKAVVPPSQKFKFSFDWEATEDTATDLNPLYMQKHATSLLFGRGFVAGIDHREQRKLNTFYDDMIKDRPTQRAAEVEALRDEKKVEARKAKEEAKAEAKILADRHWREKKLHEMEERDWRIFKEDFRISSRGAGVPHPIRFWEESGLPKVLLDTLKKVGYKDPTPIQRAGIPVGLINKDVVGIAETGSGKTCAFLLPMLVYISKLPPMTPLLAAEGPYAIVMAPTRELAQQISEEADKFGTPLGIRSVSIVGGQSIEEQGVAMRNGAEILIATPGRLFDCIERRYLVLNQCNYVVLDEADRMIDLNFEPQINRIFEAMPASNVRPEDVEEENKLREEKRGLIYRQTIMFSATMPVKVELMAKKHLRNPIFLAVGDRAGAASKDVTQRVEWMASDNAKKTRLLEILAEDPAPFIVFCNSKKQCDHIAKFVEGNGHSSTVLHSGKIQDQRETNLAGFKAGEFDVLVATDVVGRGIDITGVEQVINFELPKTIDKYTHRIGRTGRAGRKGVATSFLTNEDADLMFDLKEMLTSSNNLVPLELSRHEASKQKPGEVSQKGGHGGGHGGGAPGFARAGVIYAK